MGTATLRIDHHRRSISRSTAPKHRLDDLLPTGIERLDLLLGGGLERGQITEIVGAPSSGRTSVLFSILAQATGRGEMVAYVDAFDSLDPNFAEKSGIDLRRYFGSVVELPLIHTPLSPGRLSKQPTSWLERGE